MAENLQDILTGFNAINITSRIPLRGLAAPGIFDLDQLLLFGQPF